MRLRTALFNIHLWLGLSAGIFIALLGITGSIMAFEQEIEHALHPHLWYVPPPPGARSLTLAQIGAAVKQAFPDDTISCYLVATKPGLSDQVGLSRSLVFVNQYSGAILGQQRFGGPDLLNVIHQLHTHLLFRGLGDLGGKVVSSAALVLFVMLLSGLYLWWPLKRIRISWRGSAARRSWFDLHNTIGVVSLVVLLALCATGIAIGFEKASSRLFYKMTGSQPAPRPSLHVAIPTAHAVQIGPDSAFAIARAALPGAAPFEADMPAPNEAYLVRARYPEDLTPGGRSQVLIDSYTGRVLFAQGSRTAPGGTRMVNTNRAIHTGDIGGIPGKIIVSLASLGLALQVITGLLMWIRRSQREV
ncbi:MAG TPA: PepSY-associated TM helix domain-containing protein [Gemmatimonadales bacterium]|nr:PepSY-associated TM helix domain-containing protein [Gemmatimonadales bacterium]